MKKLSKKTLIGIVLAGTIISLATFQVSYNVTITEKPKCTGTDYIDKKTSDDGVCSDKVQNKVIKSGLPLGYYKEATGWDTGYDFSFGLFLANSLICIGLVYGGVIALNMSKKSGKQK